MSTLILFPGFGARYHLNGRITLLLPRERSATNTSLLVHAPFFSFVSSNDLISLKRTAYSGSQPTPHFITTLRAIVGLLPRPLPASEVRDAKDVPVDIDNAEDTYMTLRERFDFFILFMIFGVLVSGTNTFSLLSNEILEPYGYSDDTAGFMVRVFHPRNVSQFTKCNMDYDRVQRSSSLALSPRS